MTELIDLHAFADGELSPAELRAMREWIERNPSAQAELNAISNLKDHVRTCAVKVEHEECWQACVKRLNELDRSKRVELFVGKYSWALCAILFAFIVAGRSAVTHGQAETVRAADFGMIHSSPQAPSAAAERLFGQILAQAHSNRSQVQILNRSSGMLDDVPVDRVELADHAGGLTYYLMQVRVNLEGAAPLPDGSGLFSGSIPSSTSQQPNLNYVFWFDDEGTTHVLTGQRSIDDLVRASVVLGLRPSAN